MDIDNKKVAKYLLLPEILPRFRNLFGTGFSYMGYNLALVFRAARLIPENHPYLISSNIGRYGVTHVIALASSNLKLNLKNIDQLAIFAVIFFGLVLLLFQLLMLAGAFFVSSAGAAPPLPTNFLEFFGTPNPINPNPPTHDVAFILLERVLGVPGPGGTPGFFNTCVSQNIGCFQPIQAFGYVVWNGGGAWGTIQSDGPFPWPFHDALRQMMQLYSTGILVVGMLIFLYFMVAVIAETAQTGTPFGKRFNHVWAPLRIVIALGLIVPVANGLNSAQYICLYMAKWGSNFATNGWYRFHVTATQGGNTILGPAVNQVAIPQMPEISLYLEFFTVMAACMYMDNLDRTAANGPGNRPVQGYIVRDFRTAQNAGGGAVSLPLLGTNMLTALQFSNYQDIHIVFGKENQTEFGDFKGFVEPTCGEILFKVNHFNPARSPGGWIVQETYWDAIGIDYDWARSTGFGPATSCFVGGFPGGCPFAEPIIQCHYGKEEDTDCPAAIVKPTISEVADYYDVILDNDVRNAIDNGVLAAAADARWNEDFLALGWGGAAIWFNRIAQINGELTAAVKNFPVPYRYPMAMEQTKDDNFANSDTVSFRERFKPYLPTETTVEERNIDANSQVHVMWLVQSLYFGYYPDTTKNVVRDVIMAFFGLEGLFNMAKNQATGVHPLAQLAIIGKGLVESGIKAFAAAGGAYVGGGIAYIFDAHGIGTALETIGGLAKTVAGLGLSIGFVLFYIVPLFPFIYFFFAVGGWVKGIFEAMVGLPLWGLAHIRIDGNGLPGDAAMNGYYLILEIFIRPILIVFGLVASMIIFQAQVQILHDIWPVVTNNLTGFDEVNYANSPETGNFAWLRGHVDTLFFTIIYAIVVYMLGMSAFKLIDLMPNFILRWMGASVQTFGEQAGDPAQNLVRNTLVGGQMLNSKLSGAGGQMGEALKQAKGPPGG